MKLMNKEQFEVLMDFHEKLVRIKPKSQTVSDAKIISVDGLEVVSGQGVNRSRKACAKSLVAALTERQNMLTKWLTADNSERAKLYSLDKSRPPRNEVFTALFSVQSGSSVYAMCKEHDVNEPSITALTKRFKRYDDAALALKNAS